MTTSEVPETVTSKVLVLGGSGFVGPVLVRLLRTKGCDVTLLNRGYHRLADVSQLIADRNDASSMEDIANAFEHFDAIIDLCCYTARQAEIAFGCLQDKCDLWIHLSSAAVYSPASAVPWNERAAIGGAPIWGSYGRDKSAADEYILSAPKPATVVLRPPYLYGPGNNMDRETFIWRRVLRGRHVLVPRNGQTRIQLLL